MSALKQRLLAILSLGALALAQIGAAQAQQIKVSAADPASTNQGAVSLNVTTNTPVVVATAPRRNKSRSA